MIISDMNMPVMDRIEFTRQIKKYPSCKFVPVVMLSSEKNKDKISETRKVGISTFLSKPLNEKQLKTILQLPSISVELLECLLGLKFLTARTKFFLIIR